MKLIFHALHENKLPFINGGEPLDYAWLEIPIWLSLTVIVGTLAVTAASGRCWRRAGWSQQAAGRRDRAAPRLGRRLGVRPRPVG